MTLPEFLALPDEKIEATVSQLLQSASADTERKWGTMDAQQMVEHLSLSIKAALKGVNPDIEPTPHKGFLYTEDEIQQGIKGLPAREHHYASIDEAIPSLVEAVNRFYAAPRDMVMSSHPRFGPMSWQDWNLMQRKHIYHHFKQFGLV